MLVWLLSANCILTTRGQPIFIPQRIFDYISKACAKVSAIGLSTDSAAGGFPPYNIEVRDENRYAITLAVAGFDRSELDIVVEKEVLTIRGRKAGNEERRYLHQGIANRSFERKFNLADHVQVTNAELNNGLLTVNMVREIPEEMKPRTIAISQDEAVIEHDAADGEKAA